MSDLVGAFDTLDRYGCEVTCDPTKIACQLSRLVDGSGAWDWNSFWTTLAATLIGGAISLFAVWMGFWWQSRHRYREVLDDCVVRVLDQIAIHATALRDVREQRDEIAFYEKRGLDYFGKTGEQPLREPANFAMSITLEIALMRARKNDQSIIAAAISAYEHIGEGAELGVQQRVLGLIGGALSKWRGGSFSDQDTLDSLARAAAYAEPNDVDVEIED